MSVIPTIATVVGSSVSSAVYTSIVTTGDVGAAALGKGINYLGRGIGYGAELLGSSRFATLSRAAGTIAGLGVAGIAHTSIALYTYAVAAYERYKEPVMAAITDAAAVASDTVMKKIQSEPSLTASEERENIKRTEL